VIFYRAEKGSGCERRQGIKDSSELGSGCVVALLQAWGPED